MDGKILIVDDDKTLVSILRDTLKAVEFDVDTAHSVAEGKAKLQDQEFDVAIVDLHMPEEDGFALLEWMADNSTVIPIVLSGTSSIEEAVSAVRRDAFDFVIKPVTDFDVFFQRLQRAVDYRRVVTSRDQLLIQLQAKTAELANRLEQLSLAHKTLKAHAMAVQADLVRARRIQQRLLPRATPFQDRVSLSALYLPAGKVGGDLFDVFSINEDKLGLYIADVSGHGISSAMLTVFLKDAVHAVEREREADFLARPEEVLSELNRMVFEDLGCFDMFISMTYLVLDVNSYELVFSNAGHPPLLLKSKAKGVRKVALQAPALGIDPKANFGRGELHLHDGDMVVLYTDGIREAHNEKSQFYGLSHLKEALEKSDCHADIMANDLEKDLQAFCKGHPIPDDVTLVVLGTEPQRIPFLTSEADEPVEEEPPHISTECELSIARQSGRRFVSVRGAGTWKDSKRFRVMCEAAIEEKDWSVIVDLRECTHLDSTFLGILHDLVSTFDETKECIIELQDIQRPLLREMSELGLTAVLNHVRHRPIHVPDTCHEKEGEGILSKDDMGRLLLLAHEALVDADPRNADRFNAVLKVLHAQAKSKED